MRITIQRLLLVGFVAAAALRCPGTRTVAGRALPKPDLVVAQDGAGDYETVREALDDAEPGDVILIRPGVYAEEVEIEEDEGPFTLVGADPATTVIDADGEYAALTLKSSGNRVSGLTLRGGESHGLYIPGGTQTIDYCLIVKNGDRGIYISALSGGGSADINHCTIADNEVSGIYCSNPEGRTTIRNSIIAMNARSLAYDDKGSSLVVNYTCLYSADSKSDQVRVGKNNLFDDPRFRSPGQGDYRLKPDSPCRNAADDGANLGCF